MRAKGGPRTAAGVASLKAQSNPSLPEFRVYAETRELSVTAPECQRQRLLPFMKPCISRVGRSAHTTENVPGTISA
ncbi:MAG: hypothetical protein GX456_20310 [Verrucomicrobia bacterium]|nr:hypothetical protein [Verrucomicrobiota bacterium]